MAFEFVHTHSIGRKHLGIVQRLYFNCLEDNQDWNPRLDMVISETARDAVLFHM